MPFTTWFHEAAAAEPSLVGGKGVNLGRLAGAGFAVPDGFVVTTHAYAEMVSSIDEPLRQALDAIDFSDSASLDRGASAIRRLIHEAPAPAAVMSEVDAMYAQLGADSYVAVRSSGTAEDLAEASFAGLHDTFLEIRGAADVAQAVQRCWASMWTARALAYREQNAFDQTTARIAVVVQQMVSPEVAGVMFTANPLSAATDEFVLDASWGLGEAVVSGMVTPDQFIVAANDLRIKHRQLGLKERRVLRDPGGSSGTVTEDVPAAERETYCLSEDHVDRIALLGRDVMDYFGGMPQDIEWAMADGQVYLLQSRPVTGVEFSWDAEVNTSSEVWGDWDSADDTIWTRAWADEAWTGPTTPLFYSLRMPSLAIAESRANQLRCLPEAARMRYMTFYKAKAYFNTTLHRETLTKTSLPFMRPGQQADWLPPTWRNDAVAAPLSMGAYLALVARMNLLSGKQDLVRWRHEMQSFIDDPQWHPDALPRLDRLSASELIAWVHKLMRREQDFCTRTWYAWVQYPRDIMAWFQVMLSWYDGDRPEILGDLLAGSIRQSKTQLENVEFCLVAKRIVEEPALRASFDEHKGPAFFAVCKHSEAGKEFLRHYAAFRDKWFFRGHEDRDMYFARRGEDPWIDYRNLEALLSSDDSLEVEKREHAVNARRVAALDEVVTNFKRQPFGVLRAELFKLTHNYFHEWLVLRDDERWSTDRTTMCQRMVMQEYGRRLLARGLIHNADDYYFLTLGELQQLGAAASAEPKVDAKIQARRRDFERLWHRDVKLPLWLKHDQGVDLDAEAADDSDGTLEGLATSSGRASGQARIIARIQDIGTIRKGEILVCNSTDPGWTAAFAVVSGIVTETGGILAHASCLAREYGLPAVQIIDAMQRIPDGARITIDGAAGRVYLDEPANA